VWVEEIEAIFSEEVSQALSSADSDIIEQLAQQVEQQEHFFASEVSALSVE
jgi:hypothetical protein